MIFTILQLSSRHKNRLCDTTVNTLNSKALKHTTSSCGLITRNDYFPYIDRNLMKAVNCICRILTLQIKESTMPKYSIWHNHSSDSTTSQILALTALRWYSTTNSLNTFLFVRQGANPFDQFLSVEKECSTQQGYFMLRLY